MMDKLFDDFNKEIDADYRDIEKAKFDDDDKDSSDANSENNDGDDDYDDSDSERENEIDGENEDDDLNDGEDDDSEDDDKVIVSEKGEHSVRKKPRKSFFRKVFNFFIAIIILVILFAVAMGILLKLGVDDLNNDDNYLLVVQDKNVAKSGTLFERSSNEETIINIELFPSLNKISDFYEYANKANSANKIDRLLVFDTSVIREYSEGDTFEFRGHQIEINMFAKYLSGEEPIPQKLKNDDLAEWETRSHMLGDWIDTFHKNIFTSVGKNYKRLANDYRQNRMIVYPSNSALFVVKLIPFERVI